MTIHYFPPNPEKIGNNLLAAELPQDVVTSGWSGTCCTIANHAAPVVVGLRETIANARACIGGATGLTHLACAMRRPALSLWRTDDHAVFAPRPG